mmetsp:Transcript_63720/g.136996  ORF Transcript_63720/g.136996 Transcript_63720/m.136996 type:complete len:370 (+) Transcript_63720:100-1209(+)
MSRRRVKEVHAVHDEYRSLRSAEQGTHLPLQRRRLHTDVGQEVFPDEGQGGCEAQEDGQPADALPWDQAKDRHGDGGCQGVPVDTYHLSEIDGLDVVAGAVERNARNDRHASQEPVDHPSRKADKTIVRLEVVAVVCHEHPCKVPRRRQKQHGGCCDPEGAVEVRPHTKVVRCPARWWWVRHQGESQPLDDVVGADVEKLLCVGEQWSEQAGHGSTVLGTGNGEDAAHKAAAAESRKAATSAAASASTWPRADYAARRVVERDSLALGCGDLATRGLAKWLHRCQRLRLHSHRLAVPVWRLHLQVGVPRLVLINLRGAAVERQCVRPQPARKLGHVPLSQVGHGVVEILLSILRGVPRPVRGQRRHGGN